MRNSEGLRPSEEELFVRCTGMLSGNDQEQIEERCERDLEDRKMFCGIARRVPIDQQQESVWGRTPVRRRPVCYRATPAGGVSCMVCHSDFYMRAEEQEEQVKPARSVSVRSTTRGSITSVEQSAEEETQGAPTIWIEPVRREEDAIPDYGVFTATGTMGL